MLERDEFVRLAVGPFQRELLAYCYRMLGSVQDAEDTVQDTFLRAWRAFDRFDPQRASLRTWLYRIATNVCLTALRNRDRRVLPSAIAPVYDDADVPPLDRRPEIPWLEPIPDLLLGSESPDPASVVTTRTSVRLAFVAALQLLSPRQRAALILRDVLAWQSHEVADFMDTSTAAVNSALQRARAQMTQQMPIEEDIDEPEESDQRSVVDSYVSAFESSDMSALTSLLHRDAVLEMPPILAWFAGRDAMLRFFVHNERRRRPGAWRMLPTGANRQPAVVAYLRGEDEQLRAHSVHVFSIGPLGIMRIVAFTAPGLFERFGMPLICTEE